MATSVLTFGDGTLKKIERCVPVECPIALEYNGIGYAVMMGTPTDLQDFVIGFTVSEGLAPAHDISDPVIFETDGGYVVRCNLPSESLPKILARARTRVSESGCGICGIDSIAAALAPLPNVSNPPQVTPNSVHQALEALYDHQHMARATGASHAAAWCSAHGAILCVREDVGRHNAFDKLIGSVSQSSLNLREGFALLSARCSQELVEKAIRAGITILVTISAPSSLAITRAQEAGLTLIALARSDTALILNDPHSLFT
ncbi:formate dehydrogenase accessory sulfurtransferase FdhD [Sphingopyxis sp. BSNA05]|nr:formate dehydrogenase accessory sulfurtransferase FdhD [Sphingopyxis sp. BSNA05]